MPMSEVKSLREAESSRSAATSAALRVGAADDDDGRAGVMELALVSFVPYPS
jgi:hypothetical protein